MEPGTSVDIETFGDEPAAGERRTGDGARAVLSARSTRRDDRGEKELGEPESHIILGED
ncbi:hypothetical protein G5C60_32625 [Streptomyces sp. HC44]|uniref:Uncharacterized protein n=1 Tax=Streptomyces scabichelini TaxID=2711217 RepID=A0A6G4VEA3_9ACTN|nr:hypothetical protein [Streptomyces scabichelini]NGO12225.1 hypothetical protein [Streptomyces scabichelini]